MTPSPGPNLTRPRIGVVGAGAMGTLFATRLCAAGFEVHLIVRLEVQAREIRERGLRLTIPAAGGGGGELRAQPASVRATDLPPDFQALPEPGFGHGPRACDLVLVMVKANDTAGAVPAVLGLTGDDTLVLTLQNGLGNAEALAAGGVPPARLLCGVTTQGASLLGPGNAAYAGGGETMIGWHDPMGRGSPGIAGAALDALGRAGFEVRWRSPIAPWVWGKLAVNVAINPVTAILGVPNGALAELSEIHGVMKGALAETSAVAAAGGVDLPYPDPWAQVMAVVRATQSNRSSMLQDLDRGRPTEIDAICGEVGRRGRLLGIYTPVNDCLAALVGALSRCRAVAAAGRPPGS